MPYKETHIFILKNGLTRFVTRYAYVIAIAQVEGNCACSILHPNLFNFCNLYCIFIIRNHNVHALDFGIWKCNISYKNKKGLRWKILLAQSPSTCAIVVTYASLVTNLVTPFFKLRWVTHMYCWLISNIRCPTLVFKFITISWWWIHALHPPMFCMPQMHQIWT